MAQNVEHVQPMGETIGSGPIKGPESSPLEGATNLARREEWGSIADILKSIENTSKRSPRPVPSVGVPRRMPPLNENIQTSPLMGERGGQGMQQLDHLLRLMEQMCALRRQNHKLREHAQYLTAIKTLQDIRNEQLQHDCSCEVHRNLSDHSGSSSPMEHNLGNLESFSDPESHVGDDEIETKYRSNRAERRTGRTISREPTKSGSMKKRSKSLDPFGDEAEEENVKERGRPGIFSKFEKMKEKLTNRRGSVKRRSGVKGFDEDGKKYDAELGVPMDGLETKSEDSGFYQAALDDSALPMPQRFDIPPRDDEEFSEGDPEVFDQRQPSPAGKTEQRHTRKVSDVSTGSSSEDFNETKKKHKKYKSSSSSPNQRNQSAFPASGSSPSDHNEDTLRVRSRRSRFSKSSSFQDFHHSSRDTDPSPSAIPDPVLIRSHARLEQSLSVDSEVQEHSGRLADSQLPHMGSVDSKLGQKRKHGQKKPLVDFSDPSLSSSPESRGGGDQLPRSSSPPEKKRTKEESTEGTPGTKSAVVPSTDMMTMYENIQANLSEDFLSKLEAWDKKKQKEGTDMPKQSSVESTSSDPPVVISSSEPPPELLLQNFTEEFSKKLADWDNKKKKGAVGPSPKGDRKQKGEEKKLKEKKEKSKKEEKKSEKKSEEIPPPPSKKSSDGERVPHSTRKVMVVENEEGLVKLEGASKDFEEKYREWQQMHRPSAEEGEAKETGADEAADGADAVSPPRSAYPLPAFRNVSDSNSSLATPMIVEPSRVQSSGPMHEMASQAEFPDDGGADGSPGSPGDEPFINLERRNSLLAEKLKQKNVNLKVVQSELLVVQEQLEKMAGWKGAFAAQPSKPVAQVQTIQEDQPLEGSEGSATNAENIATDTITTDTTTATPSTNATVTPTTTTEELTKSLQQRENLIKFLSLEVERQRREISFLRNDGMGGAHFKRAKSFSARDRNFDSKAMHVMDLPMGKSLARRKKDSPNSTPSLSNADSSDQRNRESLSFTTESTQSLETLHISAEDIRMEDLGSQMTLDQDQRIEEEEMEILPEVIDEVTPDLTKDMSLAMVAQPPDEHGETLPAPDVTQVKPLDSEKSDAASSNATLTPSTELAEDIKLGNVGLPVPSDETNSTPRRDDTTSRPIKDHDTRTNNITPTQTEVKHDNGEKYVSTPDTSSFLPPTPKTDATTAPVDAPLPKLGTVDLKSVDTSKSRDISPATTEPDALTLNPVKGPPSRSEDVALSQTKSSLSKSKDVSPLEGGEIPSAEQADISLPKKTVAPPSDEPVSKTDPKVVSQPKQVNVANSKLEDVHSAKPREVFTKSNDSSMSKPKDILASKPTNTTPASPPKEKSSPKPVPVKDNTSQSSSSKSTRSSPSTEVRNDVEIDQMSSLKDSQRIVRDELPTNISTPPVTKLKEPTDKSKQSPAKPKSPTGVKADTKTDEKPTSSEDSPKVQKDNPHLGKRHPLDARIPSSIVAQKINSLKEKTSSASDSDSKDERSPARRQRPEPKWKRKDVTADFQRSIGDNSKKSIVAQSRRSLEAKTPASASDSDSKDERATARRQRPESKWKLKDQTASKSSTVADSKRSFDADSKTSISTNEGATGRRQRPEPKWKLKDQTAASKTSTVGDSKRSPDADSKTSVLMDERADMRRQKPEPKLKDQTAGSKTSTVTDSKRSSDADSKTSIPDSENPASGTASKAENPIPWRRQRPEPKWKVKEPGTDYNKSAVSNLKKSIVEDKRKSLETPTNESEEGFRRGRPRTRQSFSSSLQKTPEKPEKNDGDLKETLSSMRGGLKKVQPLDKKVPVPASTVTTTTTTATFTTRSWRDRRRSGDPTAESDQDSSVRSDTDSKRSIDHPLSSKRRDSSDSVSSSRRSSPASRLIEIYDPRFAKNIAANRVEVSSVSDLKAKFSGGSVGSKSEDEGGLRNKSKAGSVKMLSQAFAVTSAVEKDSPRGAVGKVGGGGTGQSSIRSSPSISPASSCGSLASSQVPDRIKRMQDRRAHAMKDSTASKMTVEVGKPTSAPGQSGLKAVPKIQEPLLPNKIGYRSSLPNLRARFEQSEGGSGSTGLRVRQKSGSTGKLSFTVSVTETKTTTQRTTETRPTRTRVRTPRLVAVIETPGSGDKGATETVTVRLRSPSARRSEKTSNTGSNKQVDELYISEPAISTTTSHDTKSTPAEDLSASAPSLRSSAPATVKATERPVSHKAPKSPERKPLSSSDPQINNNKQETQTQEKENVPPDGLISASDGLDQSRDETKEHETDLDRVSQSNDSKLSESSKESTATSEKEAAGRTSDMNQPLGKNGGSPKGDKNAEPSSKDDSRTSKSESVSSSTDKSATKFKAGGEGSRKSKGKGRKGTGGGQQMSRKAKHHERSMSQGSSSSKESKSKGKRKASKRREREANSRNAVGSERNGNDSSGSRSSLENYPDLLAETPKIRDSLSLIEDNSNRSRKKNPRHAVAASALQGAAAAIGHALPDPARGGEIDDGDDRRSRKDKTRRGKMLSKADRLSKLDLFRRARSVDTSKVARDRSPSLERPGRSGRSSSVDRTKKRDTSPDKGKGKDNPRGGGWKRILRASNEALCDLIENDPLPPFSAGNTAQSPVVFNPHVSQPQQTSNDPCFVGGTVVGGSIFYC